MNPAIHHDPKKIASATFMYRGKFMTLKFRAQDRNEAIRHVRIAHPGATQISIVFFIMREAV